jgi:tetratricopeptide (TPR) repeat protein
MITPEELIKVLSTLRDAYNLGAPAFKKGRKGILRLLPLPKAASFAVVVAQFDGDEDGRIQDRIVNAMTSFKISGVRVLSFARSIRLSRLQFLTAGSDAEVVIAGGHTLARKYLSESGANVLIWGKVFKEESSIGAQLYWTTQETNAASNTLMRSDSLAPQASFWDQLAAMLSIALFSQLIGKLPTTTAVDPERLGSLIDTAQKLMASGLAKDFWGSQVQTLIAIAVAGALKRLGSQYSKPEVLERAVHICREIIATLDPRRAPREWDLSHTILSGALAAIGEINGDTSLLEEAVKACRAALSGWSPEDAPQDWARGQYNLAMALGQLGDHTKQGALLEESVRALHAALQIRTREDSPMEWAITQQKLGTALDVIGRATNRVEVLQQSVDALRGALTVLTSQNWPQEWARTNNNLGRALMALGRQNNAIEYLRQSAQAYRTALTVWSQKDTPFEWARTQQNLGAVLAAYDSRSPSVMSLREAADAFGKALTIDTWVRASPMLQNLLQEVQGRLLQRKAAAVDYADCLRDKLLMDERELDILALTGRTQQLIEHLDHLLNEALAFFIQFGWDRSAEQTVRGFLARREKWLTEYRSIKQAVINLYTSLISSYR